MTDLLNFTVLFVISAFLYVHWRFKKAQWFLDKNGIPYVKPTWLVGNTGDAILVKKPLAILVRDLYKTLAPHKIAGLFIFHRKSIMIRDPELIKHILVKDFSHFQNRSIEVSPEIEPLNHHLLTMKGKEWRNHRVKLTSTFTSGKIKLMFSLVKDCGDKLSKKLDSMSTEPFDVRDLCTRYTTDVIGTCAFGIEINSLDNPDSEFRTMGKKITKFRYRSLILLLLPNISKKIIKFLNLKFTDKKVEDFFYSIIEKTIEYREKNNITRYDFIDLLLSLKNQTMDKYHDYQEKFEIDEYLSQLEDKPNKDHHIGKSSSIKSTARFNDGEKRIQNGHLHRGPGIFSDITVQSMAAQAFLFYTAGFDTSSAALGYLMFELASNKEIQDKVRDEINSTIENNPEGLTYDVLGNMAYVDMVISEILRKYPPSPFLSRKCTKVYKIPNTNIIFPEQTGLIIPVFGIHLDPKYYERADEFYPEHFTEEAIANRPRYTYLPFGAGPRNCIAGRFAKMQIKIGLISMIRHFSYQVSSKMVLPITFQSNFGLLTAKKEIWLERKQITSYTSSYYREEF